MDPLVDNVHLGTLVLTEAPRWLRRHRSTTTLQALAARMKTPPPTLLRWMEVDVGGLHAPWHATSPLYPFPLDLWDAWAAEAQAGRPSALIDPSDPEPDGLRRHLVRWRGGAISLSTLSLPKMPSGTAFEGRVVPRTTLEIANLPIPYPDTWKALDRLAGDDSFFLISLLRFSRELGVNLPIHLDIASAVMAQGLDSVLRPG